MWNKLLKYEAWYMVLILKKILIDWNQKRHNLSTKVTDIIKHNDSFR